VMPQHGMSTATPAARRRSQTTAQYCHQPFTHTMHHNVTLKPVGSRRIAHSPCSIKCTVAPSGP
jgi:hypothetical protein